MKTKQSIIFIILGHNCQPVGAFNLELKNSEIKTKLKKKNVVNCTITMILNKTRMTTSIKTVV